MTAIGQVTVRYLGALAALLSLSVGALMPGAHAAEIIGDGVELRCEQTDTRLECAYRLLADSAVSGVTASVNDVQLPVTRSPTPTSSRTALLFLVDTSDLERQAVVEQNIDHMKRMLEQAPQSYDLGLATFDSDLRIEAAVGSQRQDILAAADRVRTRGPTTELYRSGLDAIEVLSKNPAEQKVLVIFSDGMAEDKAYYHSDVISAAQQTGVIIYGLGYALSETDSVALQTLRRLAEETGGVFVAADSQMMLPDTFLSDPYHRLRTSGRLWVELAGASPLSAEGPRQVNLVWILAQGTATASVELAPPTTMTAGVPTPQQSDLGDTQATTVEPATDNGRATMFPSPGLVPESATLPTYVIAIGAAGLVLLVALIALALWYFSRDRGPPAATVTMADMSTPTTVGFLEERENDNARHLIASDVFRIGRHSENDLTLHDPSISRHHAEIVRRRDGSFAISDLESMNGVFVNNRQHRKTILRDGDLVELGDVPLRFILHTESQETDEKTLLLTPLNPGSDD